MTTLFTMATTQANQSAQAQPTGNTINTAGTQDRAAQLAGVIKPIIADENHQLIVHITLLVKELQLQNNMLEKKIDVLTSLVTANKKTISKKADAAANESAATITATGEANTPNATVVAQVAPAFVNNIATYFKQRYNDTPAFREKYWTGEVKEKVESDPEYQKSIAPVKGKEKSDAEKLKVQASYAWNCLNLKTKTPAVEALFKVYQEEFKAAKVADEQAKKPAQLTTEAPTPK